MASSDSFSVDILIQFANTPIESLASNHRRIYRGESGVTSVSISSACIEAMNRSADEEMDHEHDYRSFVFRNMYDLNDIELLEFEGRHGDLIHNHVDLNRQDNNMFHQLATHIRLMTQLKELRFSNMDLSTSETLVTLMTYTRATHILVTSCRISSDFATSIIDGRFMYLCFRHCTFHDLDTLRQIRMSLAGVRTCFVVIFHECNLADDQTRVLYEEDHHYFIYIQEHRSQVIFDDDESGGDEDSGDNGDHNAGGGGDTPMNDEKCEGYEYYQEEKSDDDDSDSVMSKDTVFVGPVSTYQFVFETPSNGK